MDGGYDDGYRECACFWGRKPGSLVADFTNHVPHAEGLRVLDAGCGDGKNAGHLASIGCIVDAYDISQIAIARARAAWGDTDGITWVCADLADIEWPTAEYDAVVAYGVFHCLASPEIVEKVISGLQSATKAGGYNIIATFNDRKQDLSAHPTLHPCLLPHSRYIDYYAGWDLLHSSDRDLTEVHPNNKIKHTHALTRLLARKDLVS